MSAVPTTPAAAARAYFVARRAFRVGLAGAVSQQRLVRKLARAGHPHLLGAIEVLEALDDYCVDLAMVQAMHRRNAEQLGAL